MSNQNASLPPVGFSSLNVLRKFEHSCTEALIYTRVSSKAQLKRGDSLKSQETRCREFAQFKGYTILGTYSDDLTGKTASRQGIQDLVRFLKAHRGKKQFVVIIDDVTRFARSVRAHEDLRDSIRAAGGILESPSIEFGYSADARAFEYIAATMSQYKREQNAEQTVSRMRSRLLNGYWPFQPPIGYKHEKVKGHNGKLIVRDEPIASIIQEGLEAFASGRLTTQVELKRFLEAQPAFPKDLPNGEIRNQRITDILKRVVYAGYVQHEDWLVPLTRGKHAPLVSLQTYQRIQQRLTEKAKAPARKDLNKDFALRGFVLCGDCGKPLTAAYSRSKSGKRHPYYECFNKSCVSYRKAIRKDDLEGAFNDLLRGLRPTKQLFDLVYAMFSDAWRQRGEQLESAKAHLRNQVVALDKQIEGLVDRIVTADSDTVARAYERKIAKLDLEKKITEEKLLVRNDPTPTFKEKFEHAFTFISNPWNLWVSDNLEHKRAVLNMAFRNRLAYRRGHGFSNTDLALPFRYLTAQNVSDEVMAHRGRFELPTPRFVVWCSIQLSYRCIT